MLILVVRYGSCAKNQITGQKSFSMISRIEMILSVMSYERKNIIFYEKNF